MLPERSFGRFPTAAATFAVVLAATSVAGAASPDDRASARQHQKQADDLKKQGKLAEACTHLEEVARLDPKLPTLIELAECSEGSGNLVAAEGQWAAARDRAKHDEKPQSRSKAEQHFDAVQKRVAHLTLQLAAGGQGAQVLRDDVLLEAGSIGSALPTNPGDHVIVVKLAGHDDAKYPIKLADGANQTLAIAPGPASSGAAPAAVPPPAAPSAPSLPSASAAAPAAPAVKADAAPAPTPTGWWTSGRTAGVLLGAVGLAAVGGGTALCVIASGQNNKLGSGVNDRLALGGLSAATGGVLLISGIVLLATAGDAPAQHAHITVSPTLLVARNTTVLGAIGEF
jgi:hypothetical protein